MNFLKLFCQHLQVCVVLISKMVIIHVFLILLLYNLPRSRLMPKLHAVFPVEGKQYRGFTTETGSAASQMSSL